MMEDGSHARPEGLSKTAANSASGAGSEREFHLQEFFPYQINVLADAVSQALAQLYMQRFDLTRPEWRVLASIGDRAGLTSRDIARDTALEKMQVSRAVARLEANGHVSRKQDTSDRRNKILCLTHQGRALFQKIVPLAEARADYILSALTGDERAALEVIMGKLKNQALDLQKRG